MINNISYNCCEQYVQYCKVVLLEDLDTAQKILESVSPSDQKKLGDSGKGFNEDTWAKKSEHIMKQGLTEKFIQN